MKHIYVSQRVDIIADYNERRDSLDQRWSFFLRAVGVLPIPLHNDLETVDILLNETVPDAILLTGGNSPASYGGDAPERDKTDSLLLEFAIRHKIPLIGVCRGMQSIIIHFGGGLKKVNGHVAVRHTISGEINRTVNSYHNMAVDYVTSELMVIARSGDDSVECVRHRTFPILGIMWHPEREDYFKKDDIDLFREIIFGEVRV